MTIYKISQALDREGNTKPLPEEWTKNNYRIYFLMTGRQAILSFANDNSGRCLQTSTVESIEIYDGAVNITTRNTVYSLVPLEEK